jgi:hypothetical protein
MNMTAEERCASLAAETEDVAREDQLTLFAGNKNNLENSGNSVTFVPEKDLLNDVFNEEGEIDHDKLKRAADAIEEGIAHLNRLSLEEESGRAKGGRRNVEASSLLGADRQANSEKYNRQKPYEIAESQEKILKKYAKKMKIWLSEKNISNNSSRRLPDGAESHVYLDKNGKHVIKVTNYLVMNETPQDFLDNKISLHNHLFPDTSYELIGFTENEDGFAFVVRQPFVEGEMILNESNPELTDRMRKLLIAEMQKMGFEVNNESTYINDNYVIDDLHIGNVIITSKGNFRFIDTALRLNTKKIGYDGTREYGSGEITPDTTEDSAETVRFHIEESDNQLDEWRKEIAKLEQQISADRIMA